MGYYLHGIICKKFMYLHVRKTIWGKSEARGQNNWGGK